MFEWQLFIKLQSILDNLLHFACLKHLIIKRNLRENIWPIFKGRHNFSSKIFTLYETSKLKRTDTLFHTISYNLSIFCHNKILELRTLSTPNHNSWKERKGKAVRMIKSCCLWVWFNYMLYKKWTVYYVALLKSRH